MMQTDRAREIAAELVGTLLLVATVIGSGIMAANLSGGNQAIALLGNTIPTGAILVVLISILGPVSGAHFNPLVTVMFASAGEMEKTKILPYIVAQVAGGIAGACLANAMFDLDVFQIATTVRSGSGQWISEVVATFALFGAIFGGVRMAPNAIPWLVGLTITAAYWFTSSTSFANPAVTISRMFSDSFAGISPGSIPMFIVAQCIGAAAGTFFWRWIFKPVPALPDQ